jgi:hypothetical protein
MLFVAIFVYFILFYSFYCSQDEYEKHNNNKHDWIDIGKEDDSDEEVVGSSLIHQDEESEE